jgi:hypothetical protein
LNVIVTYLFVVRVSHPLDPARRRIKLVPTVREGTDVTCKRLCAIKICKYRNGAMQALHILNAVIVLYRVNEDFSHPPMILVCSQMSIAVPTPNLDSWDRIQI